MRYVVKQNRLKDYLFTLGFDYDQVVDRTKRQDFVYLFSDSKELRDAINFFTNFRTKGRDIGDKCCNFNT